MRLEFLLWLHPSSLLRFSLSVSGGKLNRLAQSLLEGNLRRSTGWCIIETFQPPETLTVLPVVFFQPNFDFCILFLHSRHTAVTHKHALSRIYPHTRTHSRAVAHIHAHTRTHNSGTHTRTHTHTQQWPTYTHTHVLAHTHTHTQCAIVIAGETHLKFGLLHTRWVKRCNAVSL